MAASPGSALALSLLVGFTASAEPPSGYYRQPAIHRDTIVFTAEGDLWRVTTSGGIATRLTTHPGDEGTPAISPDGEQLAFTAQYEGPTEVYVMPLAGGLPKRLTWDATRATVAGWKGDHVLASTQRFSTLPSVQLTLIDPETGSRELLPLAQASDGCFDDRGAALFFTRLHFQGSHTRRYKGGTAQNLWRFSEGDPEATPLTADYAGTSTAPMWWNQRVYFLTDRDGTMDIWSMTRDGADLRQHTRHDVYDVKAPALSNGRIVYQTGADLWRYDIQGQRDQKIDIRLSTDFDQTREKWVAKPMEYVTSVHLSPSGDRVALTARGQVFVAPRVQSRFIDVTRSATVRQRDASFMPDGKQILALSDQSGEVELWTLPANGVGAPQQLTTDGQVLRWEAIPSPDGKWIAHHDKNQRLWLFNVEHKTQKQIDENAWESFESLAWSLDSQWLAYVATADNLNRQIKLHNINTGQTVFATTDRYDSSSPAWSVDGKWLYFLSERHLQSVVSSPWGRMAPEPFFDKRTKVYSLALKAEQRSPFLPKDELQTEESKSDEKKSGGGEGASVAQTAPPPVRPSEPPQTQPTLPDVTHPAETQPSPPPAETQPAQTQPATTQPATQPALVEIELEGLAERLLEVPLPPGNYSDLSVTEKRLFWRSAETNPAPGAQPALMMAEITNKDFKAQELAKDVTSYELSLDRKALLMRKKDNLYIVDVSVGAPATLDEKVAVDLSGWTFSIVPRQEWRQMFVEAWRLERDYFYDLDMHGVDWNAILERYLPLVDRVSTRAELSDLISQMVAELSALHIFVTGGDLRKGADDIRPATLGAILERDEAGGGYRVQHIHVTDPDQPELLPPLSKPNVNVPEGEVIESINGQSLLAMDDPTILLRSKAGKQVLLTVKKPAEGNEDVQRRDVIAVPISADADAELRYHEWEYTRRLEVEKAGAGDFGYVHLRAMGAANMAEFARGFYPVFNRKGLIIDVRHNRGGNIDSWILSRLMRKAWFYWQPRVGEPYWNMQYAFRGHIVVLCNERTASDGEAFCEGVKRLGLGKVIGTRTWGGEIWLSSSNLLVDRGIATAAEVGVYGPEGEWLIEGHGVEPDIVVDNLPHATFNGEDAQLQAAIEYLKHKIEEEPVAVPQAPPHPDKSFKQGGL